MFSGIVEEAALICSFDKTKFPARLVIESKLDHSSTALGDSIAIEGVCLTVVERDRGFLSFDAVAETLRSSTLGSFDVGDKVNLERSLRLSDRLHGHLVFGHVDATIELLDRKPDGNCDKLTWSTPVGYERYIASKGSASISGVSLTVCEVTPKTFSVYIVPHTSEATTLSLKKAGDRANFEVDMLARYVVNALDKDRGLASIRQSSKIDHDFLVEHGFARAE